MQGVLFSTDEIKSFFLKILQKYYQVPTLGILNVFVYFHQNNNAKF